MYALSLDGSKSKHVMVTDHIIKTIYFDKTNRLFWSDYLSGTIYMKYLDRIDNSTTITTKRPNLGDFTVDSEEK